MPAVAESGVGRPALYQISKLAQRYAQHRQETEIISADQLAGAEVSCHFGKTEIKRRIGVRFQIASYLTRCYSFITFVYSSVYFFRFQLKKKKIFFI